MIPIFGPTNLKIYFPDGPYETTGVQMCLGLAGNPCVYTEFFDESNTLLTQAGGNRKHLLHLQSRCASRTHLISKAARAKLMDYKHANEDTDRCVASRSCEQPRAYGKPICAQHAFQSLETKRRGKIRRQYCLQNLQII